MASKQPTSRRQGRPTRSPSSTPRKTNSRASARKKPAKERTAHKPLTPHTVDHFRKYAANLRLDDGSYWKTESFQLEVVDELFAGMTEVWVLIPEGNGKTTLISGVVLYHADYTQGAVVPIGASSREQAEILHTQAGGFVRRSPGMEKRFRVLDGYRRIVSLRKGSRIQVYAADARTADGVIPTLAIIEEAHRHRDLRLYRLWRGKLKKRGGQLIAISTAGEPGSEFEEIRSRMKNSARSKVVTGCHTRAVSGKMVLHDWAIPDDGDPDDIKLVKAANPLKAIRLRDLRDDKRSPTMTDSHWQRFVCNRATRGGTQSIPESEWDALCVKRTIPDGERVTLGIDFGWRWDTTALVPIWESNGKRLVGDPEILIPPRDGSSMHPDVFKDAFERIHRRTPVEQAVFDPAASGVQIATWIEEEHGVDCIEHSQATTPMCLAYERWMEAMRECWLQHTGHAELRTHVLSAVDEILRDGRCKFVAPAERKAKHDDAKKNRVVIDGLIAGAMANSILSAPTAEAEPMVLFG